MGRGTRIRKPGLVAGALVLVSLSGCQYVGPIAIDTGRDHYNSAIHSTAKTQTLANIIRVAKHDSTSFVDVTEVAATTTLSGTANGTLSGIGAKPGTFGTLGSVTSGLTYSEAPLVHYVPLVGQGLVAQMIRPLTPDAIESLITSYWPAVAVLDLTALSLTPDQTDAFAALNIISSLVNDNHATLLAGKSELTDTQDPSRLIAPGQSKNTNANNIPANDALMIFPRDSKSPDSDPTRTRQLWRHLLRIYARTQQNVSCPDSPRACPTSPIELRTGPVKSKKAPAQLLIRVPLLKTLSGIGILKNATEPPAPKISVVRRDKYLRIRGYNWDTTSQGLGFYTLLPGDENHGDNPDNPDFELGGKYQKYDLNAEITRWITKADSKVLANRLMIYEPAGPRISDHDFIYGNRRLGTLRRYVLIIEADVAPADAYVAYPYQGRWYYIDGEDEISKKNFNLISLLLTIMSVPSTTTPITTSINAG